MLERYGGQAAHGRKDQTSHAWLDHELDMLNNMSRTLPPIFLLVAAFLVNVTLSRLVALEREQIGLLKAVGYGPWAIAAHYIKFVILIAVIGIAIGSAAGTWLGTDRHQAVRRFLPLPVSCVHPAALMSTSRPAVLSLLAAIVGAIRALWDVVRLPPAVAMQPPAPARFRRVLPAAFAIDRLFSQPTVMMVRNIARHPIRAGFTVLGMALATAILVVSLFTATLWSS